MAKKDKRATKAEANDVSMVRVARASGASTTGAAGAAPMGDPSVPVAAIAANGGPVTVGIAFGHAQHAKYTIQVFDPAGDTELTRLRGLNTDSIPDQFVLQASPAALDQTILQWSGLVSAFTPAPGQMFSVTFEVTQGGVPIPGGRVPRTGPLNIAQPFVGLLRLVTR
jgi:hypothetical protein